ncbi:MAG TPA: hypothetical protein VF950_15265 [Planctomycetota bacterium]
MGLLALDILIVALVLTSPEMNVEGVVIFVGLATLARVGLSVAWLWLSETLPRAIFTTVLLLGLEALTCLYIHFPGRTLGGEYQAWSLIPVYWANLTLGPALLLLLIVLLILRRPDVSPRIADDSSGERR